MENVLTLKINSIVTIALILADIFSIVCLVTGIIKLPQIVFVITTILISADLIYLIIYFVNKFIKALDLIVEEEFSKLK